MNPDHFKYIFNRINFSILEKIEKLVPKSLFIHLLICLFITVINLFIKLFIYQLI